MAKVSPIRKSSKPVPTEKCAICGGTKSNEAGCVYGCFWTLEGFLGFNPRAGKNGKSFFRFPNATAMKQWPYGKYLTYRKMVKLARFLGWSGRENQKNTMVPVVAVAKAIPAAQTFTPAKERVAAKKWTGMGNVWYSSTMYQGVQ